MWSKLTQNRQSWQFSDNIANFLALNLCANNFTCACKPVPRRPETWYCEWFARGIIFASLASSNTHSGPDTQRWSAGCSFRGTLRKAEQCLGGIVSSATISLSSWCTGPTCNTSFSFSWLPRFLHSTYWRPSRHFHMCHRQLFWLPYTYPFACLPDWLSTFVRLSGSFSLLYICFRSNINQL